MNEFSNRIEAQRVVLRLVNRSSNFREELFGLSAKAIERWVVKNRLEDGCRLVELVADAGDALFFLANKSQEQVTEEYRLRSRRVEAIVALIREELEAGKYIPI